jgi:RHS repeat-associated protein
MVIVPAIVAVGRVSLPASPVEAADSVALLGGSAASSEGRASFAEHQRSDMALVARRQRWLDSRAARVQRVTSRMAFHGMAANASLRLLARDYGSILAGASANPAASIARMGQVVRYLSDYRAEVHTPRGLVVETSTVPLRVADGTQEKQPVDLRLAADGSWFAPVRPLTALSIARDSSGGVDVGSDGLRITLKGGDVGGRVTSGQDVFFGGVGSDMDATVAPKLHGAELFAVLRSRLSPQQVRYRLALPAGAALHTVEGGAVVSRAGVTLARVPAPTARDAQGIVVPVRMQVVGDELLLDIPHRERDVAYPVLVDPEVITITESSTGWEFIKPTCSYEYPYYEQPPIFGSAPGAGSPLSIYTPLVSFPYIWKYPCEYYEGGMPDASIAGWWRWKFPSMLMPPVTVEFEGISLSIAGGAGHTESELVNPKFFACGQASLGVFPVPSTVVLEATECPYRWVEVFLGVGSLGSKFSVTVGATLSVEAILLSSPWPIPRDHQSEEYGPSDPSQPNKPRCMLGYPVNCATGNQSETQADLTVGGRGSGLNLTRTYNSQLAAGENEAGAFGYGWTDSYSAHLVLGSHCEESVCTETATVYQDNGSTTLFEYLHEKWVPAAPLVQATFAKEGSSYIYTLPNQTKLDFESTGRLVSETDRNGNAITMSYNSKGQLESATDSAGRKLTFVYNSGGQVESVKDPMGHTVKYSYEAGNLASVTEPGESTARWQFKYDSSHQMTSETDGRGHTVTTEYDGSHRVIAQTDAMERRRKWEYKSSGEETETIITEPNGSLTIEKFNTQGLLKKVLREHETPLAITSYGYDVYDNLITVTDPNANTVRYGYDAAGDRTSETDALGHKTEWTYDSTHDIISTTTPDGETTTIKREGHGNVEEISRPAPGKTTQKTTYKYDSHGDLESVTNGLEHTWKYEYDSQGDRTSETDPEGDKRTWEYNEDSQDVAMVSPRGNAKGEASKYTTKIERDAQGRPDMVTDPLGHKTKYTYDSNGNLETLTDPNGNKTKYTYDADNEQIKIEEPNGTITETGYDSAGQVTSQTDGNKRTTKYVRNALEEVTEVIDPRERRTIQKYDANGNLTSVTNAAELATTYKYDAANRLTEVSYADGKTHAVKYEYNSDGMCTHMTDGTGETSYTYDQLDRPTESQNGHKEVIKYEYDLANDLTKITYPNGKAVTRVFDKDGRLQKVTDWLEHATKFAYNADSQLNETKFPSGTGEEDKYFYNEADQMSEVKMSKGAETLASLVYARDNNGQVKNATTKGLPGEESTTYTYNVRSELNKAGTIAYEYDGANNPLKIGSSSYTYDKADELETGTGVKYTYNEVGERTKTTPSGVAATTYGYDQAGNLISVGRPEEGSTPAINDTYTYDGNNLRASQTIAGTTTYLAWNLSQPAPVLLSDGTNSYIYGPGGLPIEQINTSTGTVTYLHHDQQGSTRLLTGSTGTVTGKCTYSAYGTPACEGTTTTPLGYDAQYTSSDTGLIYMRVREYDPTTAQFLSVDPLTVLTGEPYTYATDSPTNNIDPNGFEAIPIPIEGPAPACLTPETIGPCALVVGGGYVITEGVKSIVNAWAGEEAGNNEGEAFLKKRQAEEAAKESEQGCEPTPPGYDPETWTKGPASRAKEPGENFYDPEGGEWHYHPPDSYHDTPHWDYKPPQPWNAEWESIPIP